MAYADLRQFLKALAGAGQLIRIEEEVLPEPDLAAAARAAANLGEAAPAVVFDRIYGFERARVAVNVHGSWRNHALALGLPPDTPLPEQFREFTRRWENFPVPVQRHDNAAFMDNCAGPAADLHQLLPLFRLNSFDGGCFLDKAIVVSRDPDDPDHFGKQNAGIYRMQVTGPGRLGLQPASSHDIGRHLKVAEARGEDLPVAIALGNEPVISIVAGMPLRYEESEYEMAGALQGTPYAVARAPKTGLDVPAGAEVVIEGRILARERAIEGPFGEVTGQYSGGRLQPVIAVDQVWHRTDPIFEHLYLGRPWTEVDYLVGVSTSAAIFRQLADDFPEVEAVNAMYTHGLLAVISTRSRYGGFAKAAALRALTTPHGLGYCKILIVVDADVDPFNLAQVMSAVSTRCDPAADVTLLPGLPVFPLDPASPVPGISTKIVIDATVPAPPDRRGRFGQQLADPPSTKSWEQKLRRMLQEAPHAQS
ncbi:non-oxidative hydroxyarylic acid decarboxylases subunit C [Streptomyces globisporus]|uniref:non-oxidative hydroxyarylic acid decarboxylases subunit C n=1 Tax=Streptomyces globisporus TaxID=1908 RepID=UPI0004C997B8|nr:non-oxidative hydroxyarylic acid decarboxylases subunit C [Streptomyces globisporus]